MVEKRRQPPFVKGAANMPDDPATAKAWAATLKREALRRQEEERKRAERDALPKHQQLTFLEPPEPPPV